MRLPSRGLEAVAFLSSFASSASLSLLASPGAARGPRPGPGSSGPDSASAPESSVAPWVPVSDDPSRLRGPAGASSLLPPSRLGSSPGSRPDSDPAWVPPEPVSFCSERGRSSGSPPLWLPLSWASWASLSRQELPGSPPDVSPSRVGAEGPCPFPLLLRRPRLPVFPSPPPSPSGRLSPFWRPARLSHPRRLALPCLPWVGGGPAPGRLPPLFLSPLGFRWPPEVPWPPRVAGSNSGLAPWALLLWPCWGSPLGKPSALADRDSCAPEASFLGPSRRWGALPFLPPMAGAAKRGFPAPSSSPDPQDVAVHSLPQP